MSKRFGRKRLREFREEINLLRACNKIALEQHERLLKKYTKLSNAIKDENYNKSTKD